MKVTRRRGKKKPRKGKGKEETEAQKAKREEKDRKAQEKKDKQDQEKEQKRQEKEKKDQLKKEQRKSNQVYRGKWFSENSKLLLPYMRMLSMFVWGNLPTIVSMIHVYLSPY